MRAARTIRPSLNRTPFLNLPQSVRTDCARSFAEVVSETISLRHCKTSKAECDTENLSATLKLGPVKVLATHGTAIDMQALPQDQSCFLIPLETKAEIYIDRNTFSLGQAQDLIYLPPKPWDMAVKSPYLSALIIVVETRAIHALMSSHSGMDQQKQSLEEALDKPMSLSSQTSLGESFVGSVYANLRFIESAMVQDAGGARSLLDMGDLLLRQLVFLWNDKLQHQERKTTCVLDMDQLVDWMHQHCCEPLCLADLEALSGYTSRHLQRAFQKRFGCGPMQYLRKERLNLACHKLETAPSGTRILDIAEACGYGSTSSFCRDFKEAYKVTPRSKLGSLWRSNHP